LDLLTSYTFGQLGTEGNAVLLLFYTHCCSPVNLALVIDLWMLVVLGSVTPGSLLLNFIRHTLSDNMEINL
jgi:hypothetical protein